MPSKKNNHNLGSPTLDPSLKGVFASPRILMLVLAACVRRMGGFVAFSEMEIQAMEHSNLFTKQEGNQMLFSEQPFEKTSEPPRPRHVHRPADR